MSIKINRLEKGHNSYLLVCRRPAETVSLQRRQICYRWGTPAYWSLVPRNSMFYLFEFCLKNMWNCSLTQQILSHSFYDKALWIVSFKRVFNLPCGRVVYRVEKSTRVNSFTIFLLSLFYCRQNLCQVNRQFFRRTSWWSLYVPFFVWCLMEFRYPI
jgi:hypothetical protein